MKRNILIHNDNGDSQRAILNISNSLPFFEVPNIMVDNHAYQIEEIDNVDPINKIKVLDTDKDLTYIASIKNPYTDIVSALYYDEDNKELILTTHPDYFILRGTRGDNVELIAYSIGYYKESSYADSLSYPYKHTSLNLSTINKPAKYTKLTLNIHGISSRKTFRYRSGNTNTYYKDLNLIPFLKFKKSDVFGDSNLPIYKFEPLGSYRFIAKYYGYENPEYIYIPLVI